MNPDNIYIENERTFTNLRHFHLDFSTQNISATGRYCLQ